MTKVIIRSLFFLSLCYAPIVISAQDDVLPIPADVKPFIEKNMATIAIETADLNGDGRKDYILVLEKPKQKTADDLKGPRSLLILTREADGKLKLAKQNDKVVYCRTCGGVFGDPFAGITAKRNSFTVDNYGGSNWRWSDSYTFNYSRIDKAWQLVKVVKDSFKATNPDDSKTKIRTPKSFGKVDLATFDPDKIK